MKATILCHPVTINFHIPAPARPVLKNGYPDELEWKMQGNEVPDWVCTKFLTDNRGIITGVPTDVVQENGVLESQRMIGALVVCHSCSCRSAARHLADLGRVAG